MNNREFTPESEYTYDRSSVWRWLVSHAMRYPMHVVVGTLFRAGVVVAAVQVPKLMGDAFDAVAQANAEASVLLGFGLAILGISVLRGALQLLANYTAEIVALRMERDVRDELYVNLLGKSQTYHGQQRVGDIMARATNDVKQLNYMVNPGLLLLSEWLVNMVAPIAAIGIFLSVDLLPIPVLFLILFLIALRGYLRRLTPVAGALRAQFGALNATLTESIAGIEVVKSNAQEEQEHNRFRVKAEDYRDLFVKQGKIQALYLPLLMFSFCLALGLAHSLYLYTNGALTIGQVITFMGFLAMLRFPTFVSIFAFSLVKLGTAGAERILAILNAETEIDENRAGIEQRIEGEVVFDNVSFAYHGANTLKNISFQAKPGETIAIVGQTGSGKSTLTRLINRIYEVSDGRVLIDGVDVRVWSMESLRSQIATIDQDVFLFSRTLAENIAFGVRRPVNREEIEAVAKQAQAHDFIMSFKDGYDTVVGERGVTLSGGQRQRIAIARAFLADPRILVLDDSTSAIDSATEDQIQRALRNILHGRTTFLITHRLSQIRWADRILVLRGGELEDQGTHDELMARSPAYRNIFAHRDERYTAALPATLVGE
ncbi:MAG: ABC transporter ATP-binding protein [Chloroflexota bacterium]|nr:ABC transporter ATP-binding protein [Chloroflexota bacterium]MDE2932224.1 ABC transporter ATP-binding protein [Chloroflexota bacterium]